MTEDEMVRCKVEGSFDLFAAPHKLDIVYLRLISVKLLFESSIPTLAILVLSIIRQRPCLFDASEVLDILDGSLLFMTSKSLGGDTDDSFDVKQNVFNDFWRTQQATYLCPTTERFCPSDNPCKASAARETFSAIAQARRSTQL